MKSLNKYCKNAAYYKNLDKICLDSIWKGFYIMKWKNEYIDFYCHNNMFKNSESSRKLKNKEFISQKNIRMTLLLSDIDSP